MDSSLSYYGCLLRQLPFRLGCSDVHVYDSKGDNTHACVHFHYISAEKWQNGKEVRVMRERERERESPAVFPIRRRRPPHWVIYSLSSPSCPNFQPPLPPHPTPLSVSFIHSFSRLLSVGSLWTRLFGNDDRNALRQPVLLKWLTCKAEVVFTVHFFRSGINVSFPEEAARRLDIKHLLF